MSYESKLTRFSNQYPRITDVAAKAKRRIPKVAWEYLDAGTGDEHLLYRNQQALRAIRFLPRFCKGELYADAVTKLFGRTYTAPVGIAPVGLTGLMWPRIERYLSVAAKRMGIPYCLSTIAPKVSGVSVATVLKQ